MRDGCEGRGQGQRCAADAQRRVPSYSIGLI
jgi:hypothetical protein